MTLEELAARVARLEDDVARIRRQRLAVGLQAQAYELSLIHTDTQAIRAEVSALRRLFAEGEPNIAAIMHGGAIDEAAEAEVRAVLDAD